MTWLKALSKINFYQTLAMFCFAVLLFILAFKPVRGLDADKNIQEVKKESQKQNVPSQNKVRAAKVSEQHLLDFRLAVLSGDSETLKSLLDKKVHPDTLIRVEGETTTGLIVAIANGNFAMYKMFVQAGASLNGVVADQVPLVRALEKNQKSIALDLLKRKVQINKAEQGKTALMAAQSMQDVALLESLLTSGASIDAQDKDGKTALMYAVEANCFECVEILLKHNAKTDLSNQNGLSAKDFIQETSIGQQIKSLLER